MRNNRKSMSEDNSFLSNLVLWRNEPELVDEILIQAEEGNHHAQYALGLIYAEGRGVEPDNLQAYLWLSRAGAQGDVDAELLKTMVMQNMALEEIASADRILNRQRGSIR